MHKSEPDIFIGLSLALHLHCSEDTMGHGTAQTIMPTTVRMPKAADYPAKIVETHATVPGLRGLKSIGHKRQKVKVGKPTAEDATT
jgi:hypothetical protein